MENKTNISTDKFNAEDLNAEMKSQLQFEQSLSDKIAGTLTRNLGSMWFLNLNAILFFVWILWNLDLIPSLEPFDPFPFGLLTMAVSLLAIFLSVIVLISQNRQGEISDIRQQIEFEVNVRAENEITKILIMLEEIQKEMGIYKPPDKELKEMKKEIDLEEIRQKITQEETS